MGKDVRRMGETTSGEWHLRSAPVHAAHVADAAQCIPNYTHGTMQTDSRASSILDEDITGWHWPARPEALPYKMLQYIEHKLS